MRVLARVEKGDWDKGLVHVVETERQCTITSCVLFVLAIEGFETRGKKNPKVSQSKQNHGFVKSHSVEALPSRL